MQAATPITTQGAGCALSQNMEKPKAMPAQATAFVWVEMARILLPVAQRRAEVRVIEQPLLEAGRGARECPGGEDQEYRRRHQRQHGADSAEQQHQEAEAEDRECASSCLPSTGAVRQRCKRVMYTMEVLFIAGVLSTAHPLWRRLGA